MRLISQKTPAPRLLSTVVPELREITAERVSMRSRLKGVSLFSGNGRAIFIGLFVGAVLICGLGIIYTHHQAARQRAEDERRLQAIAAQSISTPAPIAISADL